MKITKRSCCKINLLLNILGKRSDGFHELETVMFPVPLHDTLYFETGTKGGIRLSIANSTLSPGEDNLVTRAGRLFEHAIHQTVHVDIALEKHIPMEAGMGGGSSNAAVTLMALNELHGNLLSMDALEALAGKLGSDVPFFLHQKPSLAQGRGESIQTWPAFPALHRKTLLLVKPAFGVSTAWAYQGLSAFPDLLNGKPGRALGLVQSLLKGSTWPQDQFFNSLEGPVLKKYPLLKLYQEKLIQFGALTSKMSGSGSTTFAIFKSAAEAELAQVRFQEYFGEENWIQIIELN